MASRYRGAAAAVVLVCGLGGCGQVPEDSNTSVPSTQFRQYVSEKERKVGQAAQDAQLVDGTASESDYETAVDRLGKCLERGGVTLVNHGWNPVNHQRMSLWYRNTDMPEDKVAAYGDQCHTAHVGRVEKRYARDHPPVMTGALLKYSRECLSGRGVATSGDETNMPGLLRAAGPKREEQVFTCVADGATKLYPQAPVVVS